MIQKIFERSVMKIGREPEHSLTITIPRKICESLQIEKGARLYFKLEGCRFVVSKDIRSLGIITSSDNNSSTAIESTKQEDKENKKGEVIADGVSLAELQY